MKNHIIDVLRDKGGLKNITFRSPVPYHELVDHYCAADIMVVPSLYDNSPYTCLEAMSCGIPVIGTSAGGMPEYIDKGKCGIIVPPGDSENLARAILELSFDKEKRIRYGFAARHKVLTVFKREIIAQKITELYNLANEIFSLLAAQVRVTVVLRLSFFEPAIPLKLCYPVDFQADLYQAHVIRFG